MRLTTSFTGLVASLLLAAPLPARAARLKIANHGAAHPDPDSLQQSLQPMTGHVHALLVRRGEGFKLAPALAMLWKSIKVGK